MFLGEYTHTVDDKGRLTIPSKFRDELEDGLVITRGFDRNLVIYTLEGFEEIANHLRAQPRSDAKVRLLRRRMFSGAVDLELDRNGRIVLPAYLREFADIDGNTVIAGSDTHIELWSADAWQPMRVEFENSEPSRWDSMGI